MAALRTGRVLADGGQGTLLAASLKPGGRFEHSSASIHSAGNILFSGFGGVILILSALGGSVTALNMYGGSLTLISAIDGLKTHCS